MKAREIENHAEFHRFTAKEGLELTINREHQEALPSIPQFEASIGSSIWPEHHQLERETQTDETTYMVPKHMLLQERCRVAELERKLELVYEILREWSKSDILSKRLNATDMKMRLDAGM
jgi:hypothetical protein